MIRNTIMLASDEVNAINDYIPESFIDAMPFHFMESSFIDGIKVFSEETIIFVTPEDFDRITSRGLKNRLIFSIDKLIELVKEPEDICGICSINTANYLKEFYGQISLAVDSEEELIYFTKDDMDIVSFGKSENGKLYCSLEAIPDNLMHVKNFLAYIEVSNLSANGISQDISMEELNEYESFFPESKYLMSIIFSRGLLCENEDDLTQEFIDILGLVAINPEELLTLVMFIAGAAISYEIKGLESSKNFILKAIDVMTKGGDISNTPKVLLVIVEKLMETLKKRE